MIDSIFTSFCALVAAFANTSPRAIPVAWPGVAFNPPDAGTWLEVVTFNNDSFELGMVTSATVEQGFFRVIACTRPGQGVVTALQLADSIVSAFPKGSGITGTIGLERTPTISSPIIDGDSIKVPVTIRWRAIR